MSIGDIIIGSLIAQWLWKQEAWLFWDILIVGIAIGVICKFITDK